MVPVGSGLRMAALTLLAVGPGGVPGLWAQHPPVDRTADEKSADFTVCTRCHAEKSTGPTVHGAVALGCNACHDVSQEDDRTSVFLTIQGNDLCFTCHDDKRHNRAILFSHAPVRKEQCVLCHDPHSSANPRLLHRPTDNLEPSKNLCLDCHSSIATQINKSKRHAAVDAGCSTCHETHKSEPAGTPQGVFHLTKPQPELCLDCHDAKDTSLREAHFKQPFDRAQCSECHNPHGSDQAKLLNDYVHPPFAEKQCDMCHQEPRDGRVVLAEGARRDLCLTCHSNMQERVDQAKSKHAPLNSDSGCVSCHSAHAAAYPYQVRRGPVDLCLSCHTEQAKARTTKAYLHAPVFSVSCLICHEEHTGDRPKRLRAGTNALCLECHGPNAIKIVQATGPVPLFGGQVTLPAKSFEDIKWLQLGPDWKRGHPNSNHPVFDAADKDKPAINCLTCHLPHAADGSPALLVTEQADTSLLCVRCHK